MNTEEVVLVKFDTEPPPITDMGVTNDKLDGVISAIGQLQADNRVLMEQLNQKVKNLGTE